MKEIPLSQGRVTIVDDGDYESLSKYKWYYRDGYAVRMSTSSTGNRITIRMHRVILGDPNEMQVDHINGNKLDNRRANLRNCTNAQNQRNTSMRSTNKSGYKGVSWDNTNKKWHAQIQLDGKGKHLGYFSNPVDAARAYDEAAIKYFGEFSNINFTN